MPAAGTPDCDWDDLLLSKEFLQNCRDIYSVPVRACETAAQEFPVKHLNIVDPLRSSNNLGRSVSRGNFTNKSINQRQLFIQLESITISKSIRSSLQY